MKTKKYFFLTIIILVFSLIQIVPSIRHQGRYSAMANADFSETYFVGTINSASSHVTWGEYQVTIYYPAISHGVGQPPERRGAPYPAIVFAHGFACTKDDYRWIGNYCALHGYVSILFTTPSRFDPFLAFPQSADGFSASIDYLISQNQENGSLLEGIVDEERIGVMGHSMGAMASLAAAAKDPRIKAVVSLAPGYFDFLSLTETYLEAAKLITAPTQIIMGSEDTICLPSSGRKYYDVIPAEKEMLIINGAFHDLGIWNAGTEPIWLGAIPGFDPIKQERYRNITTRYFISWFNYHLYRHYDYEIYIYGEEAWRDLESGLLSDLENSREYTITIVDEQSNPIENCKVTLYNQKGTILWNATTNANGTTQFKLSLTPLNYTDNLRLEAVKENISSSYEIKSLYTLGSNTIILVLSETQTIPEYPSLIYLAAVCAVSSLIGIAFSILKRKQ